MKTDYTYMGSLTGRIFLISSSESVKHWNGYNENSSDTCDYDLLDNYISYEDGDVTLFNKNNESCFLVFFGMSTKIEIFKTLKGLIICDGLYFNDPLNYSNSIVLKSIEDLSLTINMEDEKMLIFDATLSGLDLKLNEEGLYSFLTPTGNDFAIINAKMGIYKVKKIILEIETKGEMIPLKGIKIYH